MANAITATEHRPVTALHYIGQDDDRGGIASVVRVLSTAADLQGVLGVNPGFVQCRRPELPTLELPRLAGESINGTGIFRARLVAREVRRWLRAGPDRIFHGHSRAGLLIALWLHWQGERRVVVTVHCYGRQRWFYRWAAARLRERMIWLTPAMKVHYGIGTRNWEGCIPNSLPGRPAPARAARQDPRRLVIGGAGQLVRWKGWHVIVEALALLPPEIRGLVEFRHIGTTADSAESRDYARELLHLTEKRGMAEQVRWLGWQASSDGLMAGIDCLVVASDHEPFSMVALEALFAGVPVLAADSGGPTDFIQEGKNGWFFATGDAKDLARKLTGLVAVGAFAKMKISSGDLERFRTAIVGRQWVELYAQLTASG